MNSSDRNIIFVVCLSLITMAFIIVALQLHHIESNQRYLMCVAKGDCVTLREKAK